LANFILALPKARVGTVDRVVRLKPTPPDLDCPERDNHLPPDLREVGFSIPLGVQLEISYKEVDDKGNITVNRVLSFVMPSKPVSIHFENYFRLEYVNADESRAKESVEAPLSVTVQTNTTRTALHPTAIHEAIQSTQDKLDQEAKVRAEQARLLSDRLKEEADNQARLVNQRQVQAAEEAQQEAERRKAAAEKVQKDAEEASAKAKAQAEAAAAQAKLVADKAAADAEALQKKLQADLEAAKLKEEADAKAAADKAKLEAAADKAAADKAAADKAAADKAAADKAAADKAAADAKVAALTNPAPQPIVQPAPQPAPQPNKLKIL